MAEIINMMEWLSQQMVIEMNCKNVDARARQIRREAQIIRTSIKDGNSTSAHVALQVIKLHIQAIEAELNS